MINFISIVLILFALYLLAHAVYNLFLECYPKYDLNLKLDTLSKKDEVFYSRNLNILIIKHFKNVNNSLEYECFIENYGGNIEYILVEDWDDLYYIGDL